MLLRTEANDSSIILYNQTRNVWKRIWNNSSGHDISLQAGLYAGLLYPNYCRVSILHLVFSAFSNRLHQLVRKLQEDSNEARMRFLRLIRI